VERGGPTPTDVIRSIPELEALYDVPVEAARTKELDHLLPEHRAYVDASPFVVVATAGPGGLDCSPRGDPPGFVRVVDERTLLLPDRRGNNRLDTLRNIVRDPRIALLFLVPGVGVTLRVNGDAWIRTDDELRASFAIDGKLPATVIEVTTRAVYTQCPKALIRSALWDASRHRDPSELPSVGRIMQTITNGAFDGDAYDASYPERVRTTIY
jgi:PPOX class probable FMN-dependent enzyme